MNSFQAFEAAQKGANFLTFISFVWLLVAVVFFFWPGREASCALALGFAFFFQRQAIHVVHEHNK